MAVVKRLAGAGGQGSRCTAAFGEGGVKTKPSPPSVVYRSGSQTPEEEVMQDASDAEDEAEERRRKRKAEAVYRIPPRGRLGNPNNGGAPSWMIYPATLAARRAAMTREVPKSSHSATPLHPIRCIIHHWHSTNSPCVSHLPMAQRGDPVLFGSWRCT